MTKLELQDKIVELVNKTSNISVSDMEKKALCGKEEYRQGLYFLYNSSETIIYIGKVGSGERTSLYDRMKGHGPGSHSKKDKRWYSEVSFGRFNKFDKFNDSEIAVLERLAISKCGTVYNDKDTDDLVIDALSMLII